MAKAKMHGIIEGLSGSLGKGLYARTTKSGKIIISKKPDFSNRQFSEAQLDNQNRTKLAAAYAKLAARENPIYAQKAAGTDMNPYNVALRDWRRPPVIRSMRMDQDGKILVNARDDTLVTRVVVSVLDEAGQPLEQGEAEPVAGVWWEYHTANRGRILVEAWDLPGNVTRQEFRRQHPFLSGWEKIG